MEKEKVKQLLTQGDTALDLALEEQMRPEEDIVPFSICHNSRISIRMFLLSYLIKHGIDADSNVSLKDLLMQCEEINPRFSTLDISDIECRGSRVKDNDEYCLTVNAVTNCFDAANEVKKLIKDLD